MTSRNRAREAARLPALALAALLTACADQRPGAGLPPVPVPDRLQVLGPAAAEQYRERREPLDRLLEEADASDAELAAAYGELAMWHHAYRDLTVAQLAYRHARALAPEESRSIYYLAVAEAALGQPAAARENFQSFLELEPHDPAALVRFAQLAAADGKTNAARRLFADAVAADPENARALLGLGRLALAAGDFEGAAAHLEAAAELQPAAGDVRRALAEARRGTGEGSAETTEPGEAAGPNATLEDPLVAQVMALRRGTASRGAPAGDSEATLAALRQALEREPDSPEAHYNLGTLLSKLGRGDKAESHLRAALDARPDYKEARFNLANLLHRRGDLEEALAEYQRLVESQGDLVQARLFRVACLGGLGRWQEAFETLEGDVAALPQAPRLRVLRARLPATAGDPALRDGRRDRALAEEIYRRVPALPAAEAIAAAHAEFGDFERARAWQRSALEAGRDRAAERVERRLEGYREGRPCCETWADDELHGFSVKVEAPAGG